MTPQKTAQWMHEEHIRVAEYIRILKDKMAAAPRTGRDPWVAELRDIFERFRAHLTKHMALEEEGGYLAPVVEQQPSLHAEAEALRHEHAELGRLMTEIFISLKTITGNDDLLVGDCCQRIEHVLSCVSRHGAHEDHLVARASTRDVRAKD